MIFSPASDMIGQMMGNNLILSPNFWLANYPWLSLVVFWSIIWKGIALWQAGRRNQLGWFVALLLINTAGLLEIFYLVAYHDHKGKKR